MHLSVHIQISALMKVTLPLSAAFSARTGTLTSRIGRFVAIARLFAFANWFAAFFARFTRRSLPGIGGRIETSRIGGFGPLSGSSNRKGQYPVSHIHHDQLNNDRQSDLHATTTASETGTGTLVRLIGEAIISADKARDRHLIEFDMIATARDGHDHGAI